MQYLIDKPRKKLLDVPLMTTEEVACISGLGKWEVRTEAQRERPASRAGRSMSAASKLMKRPLPALLTNTPTNSSSSSFYFSSLQLEAGRLDASLASKRRLQGFWVGPLRRQVVVVFGLRHLLQLFLQTGKPRQQEQEQQQQGKTLKTTNESSFERTKRRVISISKLYFIFFDLGRALWAYTKPPKRIIFQIFNSQSIYLPLEVMGHHRLALFFRHCWLPRRRARATALQFGHHFSLLVPSQAIAHLPSSQPPFRGCVSFRSSAPDAFVHNERVGAENTHTRHRNT